MERNYTVVEDTICPKHGGRNFIYRNHSENFNREECLCEGCVAEAASHPKRASIRVSRGKRPPRK